MEKINISEEHLHTPPKNGPPRNDLRKPRILESDPDLQDDSDADLSPE